MNTENTKRLILFATARNLCSTASAVLLSLVLSARAAVAEIIPPDRLAPWQGNVGVPGGIPNRSKIYKNIVTDLRADPTGKKDCSAILNDAIVKCPANQVVYIPAGIFLVDPGVHIPYNKNVTVRGAGMGVTKIINGPGTGTFFLVGNTGSNDLGATQNIISGATKGSTTFTVSDTTGFYVGQPMNIQPATPVWAHNLGGFPDTVKNINVTVKLLSKTSTKLTFEPPCPFDFSGMSPTVTAFNPIVPDKVVTVEGIGIEDLTFDLSHGPIFAAIKWQNAWGCWMKNLEFTGIYSRTVYMDRFSRGEVRGCWAHDHSPGGPGGEGFDFIVGCSWNLIEDNILGPDGGRPPVILGDGGGGASCNVIAYNYAFLNSRTGYYDISLNHGPHNMLNLVEGNVLENYRDDGYFGSSSHNTIFRNRISDSLVLKHFSNYYNVVGNVLATAGYHTQYEALEDKHGTIPFYELGWPNAGNGSHNGTFGPTTPPDYHTLTNKLPDPDNQKRDRNVPATIIRHGNFDYVHNTVLWEPNIPDHTIPNSLYLTAKPSWWGNLPWPPVGPDLKPMAGPIPAQQRFANGMPPPAPTPGMTRESPPTHNSPSATPESQSTNLPAHDSPSATSEPQGIDLPPHDSPSATPELQQKSQKKWSRSKTGKNWAGKKNPAKEVSETPTPMGKN